MFIFKKGKTFLAVALAVFTLALAAQVNVTVGGKRGNDTLIFRGIPGSRDLQKEVLGDFKNCGWFDVVDSGVSTYIITGAWDGRTLVMKISDGAGAPLASVSVRGNDNDSVAKNAVDAVLKRLYGIPGICNSKIAFVAETGRGQKEIYLCDYDGGNFKRVTGNAALSLEPVWAPDGRSLFYSYVGRTYSVLMQVMPWSGRTRKIASYRGINGGGSLAPDGRTAAMILSKDGTVDLYLRSVDGGVPKRLTSDKAVEASPVISHDGRTICFVSDARLGRPRLHLMSISGGSPTRLQGALGSESVTPSWSKDGKIAYAARLGTFCICVADPSGRASATNPRQMTGLVASGGGDWESPSWAPDDRHVVCAHEKGLYVIDTWSGKYRKIVGGRSKLSQPDWSPVVY